MISHVHVLIFFLLLNWFCVNFIKIISHKNSEVVDRRLPLPWHVKAASFSKTHYLKSKLIKSRDYIWVPFGFFILPTKHSVCTFCSQLRNVHIRMDEWICISALEKNQNTSLLWHKKKKKKNSDLKTIKKQQMQEEVTLSSFLSP